MELRQFRHFAAVAEELHFGKAAEKLGMTQPPLSQSIQRLESELGVRLFERTHRSVELTPVGSQLLPYVREVLARTQQLPRLAQQIFGGDVGKLRIAFVSTADYGVLPHLLQRFGAQFPSVRIELLEATSDLQIDALISEQIDAGIIIGAGASTIPGSLEYLQLQTERLMLAVPDSDDSPASTTRLDRYAERPLVIFPRRVAPSLHDAITSCFSSRGLTPRFGQEAIQMQTIVSLVSAGLGIAIVPESLRSLQRTGVRYLQIEGETPEIESGLIWRKANSLPTLRNLIRIARDF